jgi:hypothetical protein
MLPDTPEIIMSVINSLKPFSKDTLPRVKVMFLRARKQLKDRLESSHYFALYMHFIRSS